MMWEDPWFLELNDHYKLIWIDLLDKCDYAGIWKVNTSLADYCFHKKVDFDGFLKSSDGRIQEFDGGRKWFIPGFLKFQYGPYSDENKIYPKIVSYLSKEGLFIPHLSPINGVKDKDKEKNKENMGGVGGKALEWFEALWRQYPKAVGKKHAKRHFLATVKTDEDYARISAALSTYRASKTVREGFVKNGSTWFNEWEDWVNYQEPKKEESDDERHARIMREIRAK